jgi:hypothetical protein
MISIHPWRLLALWIGLLGALAACTDNGARQNSGGAPYDMSQPPPERGGGGGGGGGY